MKLLWTSLLIFLAACAPDKPLAPQEGRQELGAVSAAAETQKAGPVVTGKSLSVTHWPQTFFNTANKMPAGVQEIHLKEKKSVSAGEGVHDDGFVIAPPVQTADKIFVLDSSLTLSAFEVSSFKKIWSQELIPGKQTALQSIGLGASEQAVFAVVGAGEVFAFDLNGKKLWQKDLEKPLRCVPLIGKNLIYVLSGSNLLTALDLATGEIRWQYQSLENNATLFNRLKPALTGNTLSVAFSSGEISAFDAQTGLLKWSSFIFPERSFNALEDMAAVAASPVIDGQTVFVTAALRKMKALSLKTGETLWEQSVGGTQTPLVSGNTIFLISSENKITAVNKKTGAVLWENDLPAEEKHFWIGPLLSGQTLIAARSDGFLQKISLTDGSLLENLETDQPLSVSPILTSSGLLLLSDEADLTLYE